MAKRKGVKIRIATLFSGIGAVEEALKQLSLPHEIVFACDNGGRHLGVTYKEIIAKTKQLTSAEREQYVNSLYVATEKENMVKKSYFANHEITDDRWHEDIRFLDGKKYKGTIDLLVGGSPCQSFSTYGKKRGLEDTRGTLFYDYARLVKEIKPKVFIYENVKGILCHDKGKTWKVMEKVFDDLQYNIFWKVMDARHYGLPQSRRRIFVVGIHKSLRVSRFTFPEVIPLTTKSTDLLEKRIPIEYYLPEKGFKWTTEVHRNKNKARINRDIIGCQTAVQQFNWSGDFRLEEPEDRHFECSKVFVGEYKGFKAVVRKLMPVECLRLMGFLDFRVVVDDKTAYQQSGNSIAVPVLKQLITAIYKQVDSFKEP